MLALRRKPQLFWVIAGDCVWRASPLAEWQSCTTLIGMTKSRSNRRPPLNRTHAWLRVFRPALD